MQDLTEQTKLVPEEGAAPVEEAKPTPAEAGEGGKKRTTPRRKYTLSAKVCEEYNWTWADVFTCDPLPLELPDEITQMNVRKVLSILHDIQQLLGYDLVITKFLGTPPQSDEVDEMYQRGMAVEFFCPPYNPQIIFQRLAGYNGGLAIINGRIYLDIGNRRRWRTP